MNYIRIKEITSNLVTGDIEDVFQDEIPSEVI